MLTAFLWTVAGLIPMFIAGWCARLVGRFSIALHGLKSPLESSRAYSNVRTRWLLYYIPIALLTGAAVFLMPHWGLSLFAVVYVLYQNKAGARTMLLDSVDRMTRHYTEQGLEEREAFDAANRTIAVVSGLPFRSTNYTWRYYQKRAAKRN